MVKGLLVFPILKSELDDLSFLSDLFSACSMVGAALPLTIQGGKCRHDKMCTLETNAGDDKASIMTTWCHVFTK